MSKPSRAERGRDCGRDRPAGDTFTQHTHAGKPGATGSPSYRDAGDRCRGGRPGAAGHACYVHALVPKIHTAVLIVPLTDPHWAWELRSIPS